MPPPSSLPPLPLAMATTYPRFAQLWHALTTATAAHPTNTSTVKEEPIATSHGTAEAHGRYCTTALLARALEAALADPSSVLPPSTRHMLAEAWVQDDMAQLSLASETPESSLPILGIPLNAPTPIVMDKSTQNQLYADCQQRLDRITNSIHTLTQDCEPAKGKVTLRDFPAAGSLFDAVRTLINTTNQQAQEITRAQLGLVTEYWECLEILVQLLADLWDVATHHMFGPEVDKIEAFAHYFRTIVENIYLKIRITHLESVVHWYQPGMVQALTSLRATLDHQKQSLLDQLTHVGEQLLKYQRAGPEYEQLALAYSQITENIRLVQDDIQRILA
ncbi:hypothetical protein H4R34_002774 [Dimargaris verticillata]|uniref:Uncharacterized protein n=1 Tax=Dimargaris verticillata TaxID=2761393 RepID=A0A9W8B3G7_9FUNG|nr:hypothetical protein H4R34_002774 [Dimargaris verticillata]